MLAVIAGTNRPGSNTLKIALAVRDILVNCHGDVELLDLALLPSDLMAATSYAAKPPGFNLFQDTVLAADGILTVVPEYNGSFPGILKYTIDMLRFPESLYEKPAAFVGLSSGRWGAVRAVEQLEMVFQYRHAHLYGRRVFIHDVTTKVGESGRLVDAEVEQRLEQMAHGFCDFCSRLCAEPREEA